MSDEHAISEVIIGQQKLILNKSPIFTDEGFYGISAFFEEEHFYEGLLKDDIWIGVLEVKVIS